MVYAGVIWVFVFFHSVNNSGVGYIIKDDKAGQQQRGSDL